MATILGINAFHPDSAACLVQDGRLIAAVAEERLGARVKHVAGFPAQAINSVLKLGAADIRDVEYVAFGHNHNANISAKVSHVLANPIKSAKAVAIHFNRRQKLHSLQEMIAERCGVALDRCRFQPVMVEHHLAHVASSYYASSFDQAAAFSYDGSGDFVSGMWGRCHDNQIEILDRVFVPHSLGFFYTAVCQFIGFDKFGDEYKVMGLAAYGQPAYLELMEEMLQPRPDGKYRLNMQFFRPVKKSFDECMDERGEIVLPPFYSAELIRRLGAPRRRGDEIGQREKDLARSCQVHFEKAVLNGLRRLHEEVPTPRLVTAGGCALNGVCNALILRDTPFHDPYIQCAASDDGTAIGAALFVWHSVLKGPRASYIDHAYWGPAYSDSEMGEALTGAKLAFQRYDEPELLERTAKHLAAGHVIGWYQGRSEWGPRALGNRSILAHPGWPGMKDLINMKIKRREAFRPFAPTILADHVADYFEQSLESPFMMHVVRIKPEKQKQLAAVCHEDGTGRLHTVKRTQNQLYYDLINEFKKLTGVPVVLNTSFNENEPIVDKPDQAVQCFLRTDLDVLCLGPFIVAKPGKELQVS